MPMAVAGTFANRDVEKHLHALWDFILNARLHCNIWSSLTVDEGDEEASRAWSCHMDFLQPTRRSHIFMLILSLASFVDKPNESHSVQSMTKKLGNEYRKCTGNFISFSGSYRNDKEHTRSTLENLKRGI
jgi:hypothetical protein